jgi:hypothetical protein
MKPRHSEEIMIRKLAIAFLLFAAVISSSQAFQRKVMFELFTNTY